ALVAQAVIKKAKNVKKIYFILFLLKTNLEFLQIITKNSRIPRLLLFESFSLKKAQRLRSDFFALAAKR
ncbi:MAG: hypothetical protein PUI79_03105, partial [Campylobacteraceae bacterium]|nr:hypothetical protein [Campylobacteraceae bacterium]